MIPSRYVRVGEKSPYPAKRRARGQSEEKGKEPAVTLLPPKSYLIMERSDFSWSPSPTLFRTIPPKSARNKEASSFVILGETTRTPVQSKPGSPSGRVSPFRGHGFKSPTTTRPSTRTPSPSDSPKKILPSKKPKKFIKKSDELSTGKDLGLPPKSPAKSKSQNSKVKLAEPSSAIPVLEEEEANELKGNADAKHLLKVKGLDITAENHTIISKNVSENRSGKKKAPRSTEKISQSKCPEQKLPRTPKTSQRTTPAVLKDKKSLAVLPKINAEKNEADNQESAIKKRAKPPLPPKKIGLKTTLKNEESLNEQIRTNAKDEIQEQSGDKENLRNDAKPLGLLKKNLINSNEKETNENSKEVETSSSKKKEKIKVEETNIEDMIVINYKSEECKKPETKAEEKVGKEEKIREKLVPCFQPDKCQIAPPTMASPSPIITPTISTPSMTADLASSSTKNSQSIAAAPTTITSSSLGSVSSTVVLTGNLARKEIENRNNSKGIESEKTDAGVVLEKGKRNSSPSEKVSEQMVKAASKDSIKWSNKGSLSGEITSATKVIKAEPDMEVLSPNNLRDSPPRIPHPNLAWDEGRLPNGDVPNKAENEGKFQTFISALLKFCSYLFCCRCISACKCCRKPPRDGIAKPSIFCCKGKTCQNPFECCTGRCKSKCCEEKKCCRRKPKFGNPDTVTRKCCAKVNCSCRGCCDKMKARCLITRYKINSICRSLFCLNLMCCQKFLRKFRFCHKFKCCQKDGFCSCCNPNVKKEPRKLNKKGSRTSNNSRHKDNLDVVLVEHTSLMKAAIPVLPSCLAVFCLILNLFVPGFGTFVSGLFCLCFGKPRFSVKDTPKNRFGSFTLNTIIGVAQLFTVVFCLVGWGWSIWWGVIMYKLSRRQKRLKLAEKNQKEVDGSNVNHNHVDVEQG